MRITLKLQDKKCSIIQYQIFKDGRLFATNNIYKKDKVGYLGPNF